MFYHCSWIYICNIFRYSRGSSNDYSIHHADQKNIQQNSIYHNTYEIAITDIKHIYCENNL